MYEYVVVAVVVAVVVVVVMTEDVVIYDHLITASDYHYYRIRTTPRPLIHTFFKHGGYLATWMEPMCVDSQHILSPRT